VRRRTSTAASRFRRFRSARIKCTRKRRSSAARWTSISAAPARTIAIALSAIKQIGSVVVSRAVPLRGSGADVVLNATDLARSTTSDSFPETLIQLPGTARGANGVVHMNGDHGVIDYVVDGVALPQALNREIGSEIDPNDISFLEAMEGAYPAQYGLRFGSVLNITTRAGTGPAGLDGSVSYGSYGAVTQSLGYHAPIAGGGGFDVAFSNEQTNRALDPPDFASPHNNGSDANQFVRLTLPSGGNNFTDVTLIHSFRTFQIPNDVDYGEPANTDDNETQEDTFVSAQFRHPMGRHRFVEFRPVAQGLAHCGLRRSGERLGLRGSAQRRAAALRQRRKHERLRHGPRLEELLAHHLRLLVDRR
jgi:outer membrane cobalamin receptor